MRKSFFLNAFILLFLISGVTGCKSQSLPKMNGVTVVASRDSFTTNPMDYINTVGANWIAVVPYAYSTLGEPSVRYDSTRMHWGETPKGVRETIRLAHKSDLKVMLKPQVYVPRSWPGNLDFGIDTAYQQWEKEYGTYIMLMAHIAEQTQAELFCIGTEFQILSVKRLDYWYQLIAEIRQVYHGKLTYSANWTEWQSVKFWDQLDYIGLSAYFPLVEGSTPLVDSLVKAWIPIKADLLRCSESYGKPMLFTEYGYLPTDGCGWRNWEIEPLIRSKSVAANEQAQANCYMALHQTFQKEPWWAGGFCWKWFPNYQKGDDRFIWDYSPQGKMAEQVLESWFK